MLPALKSIRPCLADVLPSCLASVQAKPNPLGLTPASKAVVVLIDGLGASALAARAGHARVLTSRLSNSNSVPINAGFPTTTASGLATLTTGVHAGVHGLVGYTALDTVNNRIMNQLNGWDEQIDPASWQRSKTVFEQAAENGIPSFAVALEKYRDSGFTRAILRGAKFCGARTIEDRFAEAGRLLREIERGIVYLYLPELDQSAHAQGWQSTKWTAGLERIDSALGTFVSALRASEGLVVTADHGVLDVPPESHIMIGEDPFLVDGIRFIAGEPRCLQLHFESDASEVLRSLVVDRWREAEGSRAWVATRDEAIAANWFGPQVDPDVVPRIGDILVSARKAVAYYDARADGTNGRSMIGQHGSMSPEELRVPLIRFGAWQG